jgi:hypothetical protein
MSDCSWVPAPAADRVALAEVWGGPGAGKELQP